MAFSAVAAVISAETVTAAMVLSAVAEVGIAMSVVGAVTGSEDLLKIGSTLGLVGGLGSMVTGLATGGASTATSAAWSEGAAGLGQDVLSNVGGEALADAATSGLESAATNSVTQSGLTGTALPDLAAQNVQGLNPTDLRLEAGTQATPGAMDMTQQTAGMAGPADVQGATTPADTNGWSQGVTDSQTRTAMGMDAPQESSGFFKSFSDFANKNKTLFNSGMQLVGGAMKGANDRSMFNEKQALERDRLKQTSYGSAVANIAPRTTGIIAGARA